MKIRLDAEELYVVLEESDRVIPQPEKRVEPERCLSSGAFMVQLFNGAWTVGYWFWESKMWSIDGYLPEEEDYSEKFAFDLIVDYRIMTFAEAQAYREREDAEALKHGGGPYATKMFQGMAIPEQLKIKKKFR